LNLISILVESHLKSTQSSILSFNFIYPFADKMSDKISICKLIGQCNYKVWSLRVKSLLVKGSLSNAIAEGGNLKKEINQKALANIRLTIKDGPLLQIQHSKTALEA